MPPNEPTIASILQSLANQFDGPVAERQVMERVLEQRPSTAKNPYATIRERLRWDGPALGWLRLDRSELVPIRVVLQGLRFRCIPTASEVETGLLPLVRLQPFVGVRGVVPLLHDATGTKLPIITVQAGMQGFSLKTGGIPGFELSSWFAATRFTSGDSIIITIVATDPLTLQFVRESAADFRVKDVADQDADLINTIVERVRRSRLPLIPCDELVLPIFARAPWRTGYPGHPWQHLVMGDGRLQIVNEVFLTDRRNGLSFYKHGFSVQPNTVGAMFDEQREADEARLGVEIDMLQHEIYRSRQQDAETGVWSGYGERASASQILFDSRRKRMRYDINPDLPDTFQRYGSDLEGLDDDWDLDDWDDEGFFDELDDLDFDDFIDQNPDLFEASQRLMAALPPETLERLQDARMEEAEAIIAAHLNDLLVREPSLFVKMDLSPAGAHSDTTDQKGYNDPLLETFWNDEPEHWDSSWEDDWEEDLDVQIPSVYTRSSDLMSQFHDHLVSIGKSLSTARSRTRDLWVYAEFLAHYYNRTLAEGDYATLDECLFFFYPCKVLNPTPRQVREICTSLKQFYGFLKERGDIGDDQFAQALWRRRHQAARVVELYDQLSRDWPNFEKLFARLFEPYSL